MNVGKQSQYVDQKDVSDRSKLIPEKCVADQSMDLEGKTKLSEQGQTNRIEGDAKNFIGGPSSWYVSPFKICDLASDNLLLLISA